MIQDYNDYQHKLLCIGGYLHESESYSSDIWYYDFHQQKWKKSPTNLPSPMGHMAISIIKNQIHVFGGFNGDSQTNVHWIIQ